MGASPPFANGERKAANDRLTHASKEAPPRRDRRAGTEWRALHVDGRRKGDRCPASPIRRLRPNKRDVTDVEIVTRVGDIEGCDRRIVSEHVGAAFAAFRRRSRGTFFPPLSFHNDAAGGDVNPIEAPPPGPSAMVPPKPVAASASWAAVISVTAARFVVLSKSHLSQAWPGEATARIREAAAPGRRRRKYARRVHQAIHSCATPRAGAHAGRSGARSAHSDRSWRRRDRSGRRTGGKARPHRLDRPLP